MNWSFGRPVIKKRLFWLADHWVLDIALVGSTIASSLLGNKYTREILALQPATGGDVHWGVTAFWLWVAAMAGIAVLKWAAGREVRRVRAEDRVEFKRQVADFEEKVAAIQTSATTIESTVVPTDMLRTFSFTHDTIHRVLVDAVSAERAANIGTPPDEMAELFRVHIRIVLSNILELVDGAEPPSMGTVYAANIMRFFPERRLNGERGPKRKDMQARLLFCPGKRSVAGAMGVLDLDAELSTSSSAPGQPDPLLASFALLVPLHQKNRNNRYHVLPGAPLAFMRKETLATDAATMVENCRSPEWDFPPKVAEELQQYLESENGGSVQSLVCHPLMERSDKMPDAILNIHSNAKSCLKDRLRRDRVVYLLRPSTLALLHLLNRLSHFERLARIAMRDQGRRPVS